MDVRVELWRKLSAEEWMLLNCGVGEDSWESLGLQGDSTNQSYRKSFLNTHWKHWYWSSKTLATWWEELTHWNRPWCWERWKAGGEGDDRGWDGWMASPTWTWVWVSSRSWRWTGKPSMLQGLQRVGHDWATELNWTDCCSWLFWISKVDCCHLVVAWPSQDWTGRTEKSVQTQRPKITFTFSLMFYHFLQATMSKNKYITCPFSQFS